MNSRIFTLIKTITILLLIVFLYACSGNGSSSKENREDSQVVGIVAAPYMQVLGDSNCDKDFATFIGVDKTWPEQLGVEYDCKEGRFLWEVESVPDRLILALGTNDGWWNRDPEAVKANYQAIIDQTSEVICVLPVNNFYELEIRSVCHTVIESPPPDYDYTHGGQAWHNEMFRRIKGVLDD